MGRKVSQDVHLPMHDGTSQRRDCGGDRETMRSRKYACAWNNRSRTDRSVRGIITQEIALPLLPKTRAKHFHRGTALESKPSVCDSERVRIDGRCFSRK